METVHYMHERMPGDEDGADEFQTCGIGGETRHNKRDSQFDPKLCHFEVYDQDLTFYIWQFRYVHIRLSQERHSRGLPLLDVRTDSRTLVIQTDFRTCAMVIFLAGCCYWPWSHPINFRVRSRSSRFTHETHFHQQTRTHRQCHYIHI